MVIGIALFVMAIGPVISDQVASISDNAPTWLDQLQRNRYVQDLDQKYDVIDRVRDYVEDGNWASGLFGGVLGFGLQVLSTLANAFVVIVLTLYFLAGLETTKNALYRLAPASRRDRVSKLGDRVIESVGGYVSGAVHRGALRRHLVADLPVHRRPRRVRRRAGLRGRAPRRHPDDRRDARRDHRQRHRLRRGPARSALVCVIFYVIYQQLENYVIYPRVMAHSVDIPGAVTVIAALIGAALLGVIGALLAIPTAAAILMLTREIVIRRQDASADAWPGRGQTAQRRRPATRALARASPRRRRARISTPPSSWTGRGISSSRHDGPHARRRRPR